jgi:hypothetical protein
MDYNHDLEDQVFEWLEGASDEEVAESLAQTASDFFGASFESYQPPAGKHARLSRNVKGQGLPDGELTDEVWSTIDSQLEELNSVLGQTSRVSIEPHGQNNGHWCFVGTWHEIIDTLFDIEAESDEDGSEWFLLVPSDTFEALMDRWNELIASNESGKSFSRLSESMLQEGAALDRLKDIEAGNSPAVTADEVAPAHPEENIDGIGYDETEDPEMSDVSMNKLIEAAMTDAAKIRGYMMSSGPHSYDGFLDSEFGDDAIPEGKFKSYVKVQSDKGDYDLTAEDESSIFTRRARGGAAVAGGKADNLYNPPSLPSGYKKSARLGSIEKKYAGQTMDTESSGNADEMFQNMIDIVADIASGVATKRHALIFGDPGVGKCHSYDTKVKIRVQDDLYSDLVEFLHSQENLAS